MRLFTCFHDDDQYNIKNVRKIASAVSIGSINSKNTRTPTTSISRYEPLSTTANNIVGMSCGSTAAIIVTVICMVLYTSWLERRKTDRKRSIMDKAKSIGRQLDCIDDIVFCHNPVYNFIKAKVNGS